MIDLAQATLLASGNGRDCFIHPRDPGLVLKVPRTTGDDRRQNDAERLYFSDLVRRGVPFHHLPRFHGEIETDRGAGLVYERLVDADGGQPVRLADGVRIGLVTYDEALRLLGVLRAYLLGYSIALADGGCHNLLLVHRDGGWRVMAIDGIGARRYGLRLWLYRHLPWMARYKTRRQWPKVLANLRHDIG